MVEVPIIPRYPSVAHALAYLMARRAVERHLLGQGERYFNMPRRYTEISERARVYLAEHQHELLAQAMDRVQRSPKLRKMAEVEQREREREQRKRARNGVLEKPTSPPQITAKLPLKRLKKIHNQKAISWVADD